MFKSSNFYWKIQNDEVYDSVLEMNWHLLPISLKREFLIVLRKTQHPKLLTAGGVLKLNMDTFVLVRRLQICIRITTIYHRKLIIWADNEEDLRSDDDAV